MPRTGTTTLARIFASHPAGRVIVEPFHPRRYEGNFLRHALEAQSATQAFKPVWSRWNVIKHVWESNGWPLRRQSLQEELWSSADVVIAVSRRNMVKRYVSAEISRILQFWIGTGEEFRSKLDAVSLLPFSDEHASSTIRRDEAALAQRREFLTARGICYTDFVFEDFFSSETEAQLASLNRLFAFAGLEDLTRNKFDRDLVQWLDPEVYRWSKEEVYGRIPKIREFDEALAHLQQGSLFD